MNSTLRPDTPAERRLREQQDRVLSKRAILVATAKQVKIDQPEAPELDAMIQHYLAALRAFRKAEHLHALELAKAASDG